MRSFLLFSSSLFASIAACGADTDDASSIVSDIVTPSSPYRHDVPASGIPDLGTSGFALASSPFATDAGSTHEGTFATGRTSGHPGTSDPTAWDPIAAGADFSQFESSPAFTTHLDEARGSAGPTLDKLSSDSLSTLATILRAFPLPIEVSDPPPIDAFYGWVPEQARWLRDQYAVTSASGAMTKQLYPDPIFGGEIRERGARLYCAARAANFQQSSSTLSMGRQVALPLDILGHEVDLGVIEATFALDGPQRFTGSSAADGAQGFEVPMLIGTAITPIAGIGLPGFGELRHPIVLTTGDTEVASALAPQWLHVGDNYLCNGGGKHPVCQTFPVYSYDAPKDYLTVTHADSFLGRSANLDINVPPVPLFTIGAFTVTLAGGGGVTVGASSTPQDRLLASAPSGWPAPRSGDATKSPWLGYVYDTEPWTAWFSLDSAIAGTSNFGLPSVGGYQSFVADDPLLMRAIADDDHHVSTSTSVDLHVNVDGDFGFQLGIAAFELIGSGNVDVGFAHHTDVRDGVLDVMGNGTGIPITALTVTPSTTAHAGVSFTVKLHVMIDLFIDSVDEWITIVDASTGKDWSPAAWDQPNRAMIATGSSYGDPTNEPWAISHLPAPGADASTMPLFDSFEENVPACLADTRVNPPTPAPCVPTASGGPIAGDLCLFSGSWLVNTPVGYGTTDSWAGACSDIAGHVDAILPGGTADQKLCYVHTLGYLCSPTSREQDWHGQHGVAHILPIGASDVDLGTIAKQCSQAFYPVSGTETFNRIFEFGVCDGSATMIDASDVVKAKGSTSSDPSEVTSGSCHTP